MKLLTFPGILNAFQANVSHADSIDLAIAWVTQSSALELLRQQHIERDLKICALVGIDTNFTTPLALKTLARFAEVRVVKSVQGIFHPKMYLFHMPDKMIVWVGSANFTNSGLNSNEELVSEFESSYEEASQWFENKWQSISVSESQELMKEYEAAWRPVHGGNLFASNVMNEVDFLAQAKVNLTCDWASYLQQLQTRNRYLIATTQSQEYPFSVLGDSYSYLGVISDGHEIILYETWDNLSEREVDILLGLSDDYGMHGLLGGMRAAGQVRHVFCEPNDNNLNIRQAIHNVVQATVQANCQTDYIQSARSALTTITDYAGFGMGVATRLLALARPDMAISLNEASKDGLAGFSGLAPSTLRKIPNYLRLLEWMYGLEWYASPSPTDPWEKSVWGKRAALVDAFVYP